MPQNQIPLFTFQASPIVRLLHSFQNEIIDIVYILKFILKSKFNLHFSAESKSAAVGSDTRTLSYIIICESEIYFKIKKNITKNFPRGQKKKKKMLHDIKFIHSL